MNGVFSSLVAWRLKWIVYSRLLVASPVKRWCVLSPLLYHLHTSDCTPIHPSTLFIKFADNTTLVKLISEEDESAYLVEVQNRSLWCWANNLILNTNKTKKLILDFRKRWADTPSPPFSWMMSVWKWSTVINFLDYTLRTASPGQQIPQLLLRKPGNKFTSPGL